MRKLALTLAALLLTSCAAQNTPSTPVDHYHTYSYTVVDGSGVPIEGAEVTFTLESGEMAVESGTERTGPDGKFLRRTLARRYHPNLLIWQSALRYVIAKGGHDAAVGRDQLLWCKAYPWEPQRTDKTITLLTDDDFLSRVFRGASDAPHERLTEMVGAVRTACGPLDAELQRYSVGVTTFRDSQYLSFALNTTTRYNTLQLDKYDVGRRLFDDVVRKLVKTVAEYDDCRRPYSGCEICVHGHMSNFVDDSDVGETVQYRFLIPNSAIAQYADMAISGEEMLKVSVVIMNGERIELRK